MNEIYDELNRLSSQIYYDTQNLDTGAKKKEVYERVLAILVEMYLAGAYRIGDDVDIDLDEMEEVIFLSIDGKTWEERINEYIASEEEWDAIVLQRIVETEGHRIFETSQFNTASNKQRRTGKQMFKTWVTMEDLLVRDTHDLLEGTTIPLDEKFYTYTGASALHPGGFGSAEEDVNCRCTLVIK